MGLVEVGHQILDALSVLVTAPCIGTVTTAGTGWMARGQIGVLPNGRLVRVTKTTRLGYAAPVRLLELQASMPSGNFAGVAAGSVVTWRTPPTGITGTSTTSAFAADPRATVAIAFASASSDLKDGADLMSCAHAGGSTGIVVLPNGVKAETLDVVGHCRLMASWKLRVISSDTRPNPVRTTQTARIFDALTTILPRTFIGDESVKVRSWERAKVEGHEAWDLEIATVFTAGDDSYADSGEPFETFAATIDDTQGVAPVQTTITL